MDLEPYIQSIRRQLEIAAEVAGDDGRELAERLAAPMDAAIRLSLQDALAAAAQEITLDLAPGSVELRLRGREPEFVVILPPDDSSGEDTGPDESAEADMWRRAAARSRASGEGDEAVARINLRLPDQLKARVEAAAADEGLSVNAWLVRTVARAIERTEPDNRPEFRTPRGAQRYKGWAR